MGIFDAAPPPTQAAIPPLPGTVAPTLGLDLRMQTAPNLMEGALAMDDWPPRPLTADDHSPEKPPALLAWQTSQDPLRCPEPRFAVAVQVRFVPQRTLIARALGFDRLG